MKKKVTAALVSLGVFVSGVCSAGNVCKGINISTLRKHVPIPPSQIVSERPVKGLCEIILKTKMGGEYVPVYAGKDFVIAGEMFANRRQITQERIAGLKAELFLSLRKEADRLTAFTYTPKGKIKHTLYMFTDPVCPFCHRAEASIKQIADRYHTRVKFIFFPVHIPVGREKAVEAVCRGLDAVTYIKGDWKKENKTDKYQCERGKKLLAQSAELARKLGIGGVPTFFLENGQRVVGANMFLLTKSLEK